MEFNITLAFFLEWNTLTTDGMEKLKILDYI